MSGINIEDDRAAVLGLIRQRLNCTDRKRSRRTLRTESVANKHFCSTIPIAVLPGRRRCAPIGVGRIVVEAETCDIISVTDARQLRSYPHHRHSPRRRRFKRLKQRIRAGRLGKRDMLAQKIAPADNRAVDRYIGRLRADDPRHIAAVALRPKNAVNDLKSRPVQIHDVGKRLVACKG